MAKITAKCEFMENALPAGRLALQGKFYTAQDSQGEHMLFSLDKRRKLCLILKNPEGHNELINLSDKFGLLPSETIGAFAVSQNKAGLIHLCFTGRKDGVADRLFVSRPMQANRDEWVKKSLADVLYNGEQWNIHIRDIKLGTGNDSLSDATQYPQIYLTFNHLNKDTEDIWALVIDTERKSWKNPNILQMPCNPDQIIDKCVGTLRRGRILYRGLFVLYRLSTPNTVQLRFVGYNPTKQAPVLQSIGQAVPMGAKLLLSVENDQGCTDLIVAGRQLTWHSANDCFAGAKSWTVLSDDALFFNPSQIYIAQSENIASIWCLNEASQLCYEEFDLNNEKAPKQRSPPIPLLEGDNSSDRFAALQHPKIGQRLFVIQKSGDMNMLSQSNETGLWGAPVEVTIPQSDEIIEFKSHTIQASIIDEQGIPITNRPIKVCCSTSTELIINGISLRGSPEGQIINTDDSGVVTVIIRSDDFMSPSITFDDGDSTKASLQGIPLTIDPMERLWKKINGIESVEDLRKIKSPDGSSFVKPGIANQDLEKAAIALRELSKARQDLSPSNTQTTLSISQSQPSTSQATFLDRFWGLWYTIRDQIKSTFDWVLKKAGDVWEFVVELAGKAWKFVLKTVSHVSEAIRQVLNTISEGWDWLVRQFERLFGWDDILDVKNVLVNLTTQGLLWGVDSIALLETKTDEFFDDLRKKVRFIKSVAMAADLASKKIGSKGELGDKDNEVLKLLEDGTLDSPAARYGLYHLQHSSSGLDSPPRGQTPLDRIVARLQKVLGQVEQLADRLIESLGSIINSKDVTIGDVLKKLGLDLLDDVIGVVQSVVTGIIGSFGDIFLELVDGINKPITIPVLSPLYKRLTHGADLTILDAISLIIAIPGALLYKTILGKKPSDIDGIKPLLELNLMKAELDERMGRLREESTTNEPQSHEIYSQSHTFSPPQKQSADFTMLSNEREKKVLPMAKTINQAFKKATNDGINQKQTDVIKSNERRFAASGLKAEEILKISIPGATYLWYFARTFPKLPLPEIYNPADSLISAGFKLITWLGQFFSLGKFTLDDVTNGNWNISARWSEAGFGHRFCIWLFGALPIVGALGGKYLQHILGLVSAVIQTALLAWLQIDTGMDYSLVLALEEWAKLGGKYATGIAGLTHGSDGFSLGVSLTLTTVGASVNLGRAISEIANNDREVYTGVDLGI